MCFTIPYKVVRLTHNFAYLEGGKKVSLGKDIHVAVGEYLQVIGDVAVGKLDKSEGLKIRKLIKKLNSYESPN